MTTVKYSYVRDPQCVERVLTIARNVVGDKIHFGFATNKVVDVNLNALPKHARAALAFSACADKLDWTVGSEDIPDSFIAGVAVVVLDKFDRKRGRTIAEGRMHKNPYVVDLVDGESPHLTVLKGIAAFTEKQHRMASRLAHDEIFYLENSDFEGIDMRI